LCRRDLVSGGQILQKVNHFEVGLERFGRKARKILPQVVRVVELHFPGNLAGEETLSQWSPGDKTNAELFAQRKLRSFSFRLAHPQRIVVLECAHRLDGMSPDRLSDLTIVVVEDQDDARRYLGLFLNQIGANVVLARNGFEGLEATKNNRPVVVSDIQMPGMDGFELLREIRAFGPDTGIPVIAMTAYCHVRRSRAHTECRLPGMLAKAVHSGQVVGCDSDVGRRPLPGRSSFPTLNKGGPGRKHALFLSVKARAQQPLQPTRCPLQPPRHT
jgi:CheY-like chemotaxis protein